MLEFTHFLVGKAHLTPMNKWWGVFLHVKWPFLPTMRPARA